MPEPPRRARFQIHLSTAIVLMFVAGGLIWANIGVSIYKLNFHGTRSTHLQYGWPFKAPLFIIEENGVQFAPRATPIFFAIFFVPDLLIAVGILLATGFTCEWLIRRRAARKGA